VCDKLCSSSLPGSSAAYTTSCNHAGVVAVVTYFDVLLLLLQVRQWNIWGLPKDDFSTENAIAIVAGENSMIVPAFVTAVHLARQ
jgi:hypothetical protein